MFRRLNRLTSELAVRAKGIAVGEMPTRDKIGECVKSQLCLWTVRSEVDVVGGRERREPQPPPARRPSHAEYSEAASLLFAPEIPSSLRPRGRSVHWALQIARESLARSEEYLAAGQYGLARSALQAAGQVLHTCKGGQGLEDVRRRVDRRLQLIDHREKDRDRLKLHQACAEMAQTVRTLLLADRAVPGPARIGGSQAAFGRVKRPHAGGLGGGVCPPSGRASRPH